jgi:hypothetical protein
MIEVLRLADCNIPSVVKDANVPAESRLIVHNFIRYSVHAWAGFSDAEFACMWGLIPPTLLSDSAYLWLIVNERVDEHKFLFIRHSQLEIAKMLEIYPKIVGHCDVRHTRSMLWLKWLGAQFDMSMGPAAPFTIVRK